MSGTTLAARVRAAADELVADGTEIGLQVAVIHRGRLIVDVAAGVVDAATGRPVTNDTLFFAASTAKGVASSLAHALVERGELAYDMRVVDVWPEFAAGGTGGKHRVTLRHVLMHTAGLPGLPRDTTVEDLCDWQRMCAVLADAEPWWPPGTRFGYHALTFGFLLGETMRRATGRTITELLREALTIPLGLEDEIHFGVPPALLPHVARQHAGDEPMPAPAPGSAADRAMPPATRPDATFANRADVLTAVIPSFGTMSARGVAWMYAALLGHAEQASFVSAPRLTDMAAIGYRGVDHVMGVLTEWAFGYSPHRPSGVPSRPGSTFGMVGSNGSAAYADIDSGVAVAVMRNRFTAGDFATVGRIDRIVAEAFSAPGGSTHE